MICIGIDPGYERCGFAILERNSEGKDLLLHSECFTTDKNLPFEERLLLLAKRLRELLTTHTPDVCALEKVFFSNNQKTAMRVAEVRGVLIVTAHEAGVVIHEFSPNEVKVAVAGDGAGSKKQVMTMVPKLIHIEKEIKYDDEYDAIAVALTATASIRTLESRG